ncbi:agmatine deiminase, putative [Geotalea daltonii FRC-32]|uniref:Agmatine deiminase, putative n=1 Tax=Geotalea daltonii (strain DSM 22248 / JCM 15807 / FRC-32) TaxID=316067 RepID=B9LZE6_GEODF|nr:agmatine deiminase family protein [Geotalea daltonii]ACM20699.1 agmatine deiminase, putative [Geotalea daltonii FRC-32]
MARLPAEWEEQDGVLVAWPHEDSDWRPWLGAVEPVFVEIAKQISRQERVVVVAPETSPVADKLKDAGAVMERIFFRQLPTNDTWSRDFGPITVQEGKKTLLLDFGFNGWGLKFAADRDNQVSRRLHEGGIFGSIPLKTVGLILEGGSIESDGRGTILTTAECLLDANRNPHLGKTDIETALAELLGAGHFLWLENGFLAGDDTDSHIDTLARLCPDDTIAYVRCDDPQDEHYQALKAMEEELVRFRTREGRPYRLVPLPWPEAKYDEDGERLPATYANFLIINNAVLVPTYQDNSDRAALAAIAEAFPRHEVIGIDCLPLILQHGSLHCVTMQLPKGTLI